MDAEEAWKIDNDEAWERFKATSVFKSSSSDKLDTMNALLNDMKVTMDRMATVIPGAQADAAAIDSANASAQPPMGMDMGMGGPGVIPDVSQLTGEDDFESEDEDMADNYDDSTVPMGDKEPEEVPAEGASAPEEAAAPEEEMPVEEAPVEEAPAEAEEAAAEMSEELPPAPIEDAGIGGATDIGTATNNLMEALDQQIMQAVQSGDKEGVMKLMDQKEQIGAILETPVESNPVEEPVPGAEDMSAPAEVPAEAAPAEDAAEEMSEDELSALIDDILAQRTTPVAASESAEIPSVSSTPDAASAGNLADGGTTPNDTTTQPVEASCSSKPTMKSEGEHPATASRSADGQTLASIEAMISERLGGVMKSSFEAVNKACSEQVNMAASDTTTPAEASESAVAEAESPTKSIGGKAPEGESELPEEPQDAVKGESKEKDDVDTVAISENPSKTVDSSEGTQSKKTIKSYNEMVAEWNAVMKGDKVAEATGIECGSSAEMLNNGQTKDPDEIATAEDPKTTIASVASQEKDDEATIEAADPASGSAAGDQGTQKTMKSAEYMELITDLKKSNKISDEDYAKLMMWKGSPVTKSAEPAQPVNVVNETQPTGKIMKSFREILMENNSGFQMPAECTPGGNVVETVNSVRKSNRQELPSITEMIAEMRGQ